MGILHEFAADAPSCELLMHVGGPEWPGVGKNDREFGESCAAEALVRKAPTGGPNGRCRCCGEQGAGGGLVHTLARGEP